MIDVHCHLDDPRLEGYVPETDISVITMGTDVESSGKAVELANKYPNVWACVGIHPENSYELGDMSYEIKQLQNLIKNKKVVGIGEVGLDYRQDIKPDDKEKQRELFEAMVRLAEETKLPIVVHNRNADEDVLTILDGLKTGVLMHCFTRGKEFMQKCVERGWYMSFGGLVTYENNSRMKAVVKELPMELLLLETDAPYSVPVGGKGDINTPANVKIVAEAVAYLKNMTIGELETATDANTKKLFNKMV
jgi:TatD DNase family protein